MTRALPLVAALALVVFCVVDCVQTPRSALRNLSRGAWLALILLVPVLGGVAWLVAGRPSRGRESAPPWPSSGPSVAAGPRRPSPKGPDDDPAFLSSLERALRDQERLRKRREEESRRVQREGQPSDETDRPEGDPRRSSG